jgi:hypothetical protein
VARGFTITGDIPRTRFYFEKSPFRWVVHFWARRSNVTDVGLSVIVIFLKRFCLVQSHRDWDIGHQFILTCNRKIKHVFDWKEKSLSIHPSCIRFNCRWRFKCTITIITQHHHWTLAKPKY